MPAAGARRWGVGDSQQLAKPLLASHRVEAVLLDLWRRQQLGGCQPFDLRLKAVFRQLAQEQLAGGDFARRDARFQTAGPGRDQVVRARGLEVRVLDDGARREHPRDDSLDDLALARLLDLVADDHLVARAQQLAYV